MAQEPSSDPATKVSELVIVSADDVDCRPAVELLQRSAAQWNPGVSVKVLADVERIITDNGQHAILLHPGFTALLVTRMMQGELPSVALARVTASSQKMLAHCRPARRHTTIVDPHRLLDRPQELIAALESRLGVAGQAVIPTSMIAGPDDVDRADASLHLMLAEAAITRSPQAMQLAAEIDAMTLGAAADKNQLGDLPDQAFRRFATVRRQMMDNATKADLLIKQVSQMEEELKRFGREAAAHADDIRRLQKARNTFEKQLQEVHSSTSWRVTRPIRAVRRMISGKANSNE